MDFVKDAREKKVQLILNITKLTLFILTFLLLLISFSATETKELYVLSGGKRYSVGKDSSYFYTNFFGRMSYLDSIGFTPVLEMLFLAVLTINVVIAIAAMIPQCKMLNKVYFAVLPLAVLVLCIVIMVDDANCSYLKGIEGPVVIDGLNVCLQEDVSFNMNLTPSLIGSALAFIVSIIPGISALLERRKVKMENKKALFSATTPQEKKHKIKQVAVFSGSVPEELKKYKELLDAEIITREEFEFKKKELLGL